MQWSVSITVDLETGAYELSIDSVDDPGAGVDYELLRRVVARVLEDMDTRVRWARDAQPDAEVVELVGDDQPFN